MILVESALKVVVTDFKASLIENNGAIVEHAALLRIMKAKESVVIQGTEISDSYFNYGKAIQVD